MYFKTISQIINTLLQKINLHGADNVGTCTRTECTEYLSRYKKTIPSHSDDL